MLHHIRAVAAPVIVTMALSMAPSHAVISHKTQKKPVLLIVFAASSLTESFTSLGRQFEQAHPGTRIQFSFLSSPALATQLIEGAPADVFASASIKDMATVVDRVSKSYLFAANRVVLAIPRANPLRIKRVQDLNKPNVKWIACAHQVPCGVAADAALAAEGTVKSKPISLESKATSVVTKIIAGEVDAAIVYRTDIVANRKFLREIPFKNSEAAMTKYPIGVVKKSAHPALAKAFVDLVLSIKGLKLLSRAGFDRAK